MNPFILRPKLSQDQAYINDMINGEQTEEKACFS